jgi:DNA-binding protein HU-beta
MSFAIFNNKSLQLRGFNKQGEFQMKVKHKDDLVAAVSAECGLTKQQTNSIVDSVTSNIIKLVAQGCDGLEDTMLRIQSFGSFSTTLREARVGRNPRTGEAIDIPATRHVSFASAILFKDEVNWHGNRNK